MRYAIAIAEKKKEDQPKVEDGVNLDGESGLVQLAHGRDHREVLAAELVGSLTEVRVRHVLDKPRHHLIGIAHLHHRHIMDQCLLND